MAVKKKQESAGPPIGQRVVASLLLGKALAASYGDIVYPGHADLPEVPKGKPWMTNGFLSGHEGSW
jgi:hypothetical protein